ncbi:MAG: orotidine-5'-phosphate decarboxylase [Dialister sp.]|nr:orotidine-5'-phosphate decarboxylase [Dialister sp.]CDA48030.1 orotidine 5'-phosphate decarboxylase [Dialister sp. CAG:486]MDD7666823.1 orotidine-5'-phosphate decarboxylase [Dialister sp.]MDY2622331.1 orotidine-5'-phosphate decarboxylase [Dialister sp.]MDY2811692.1 orotidine-5'-phosphate decarboxylase [Dialister sp.]
MAEENEIYTADDRLIVALDVDSFDKMKALVDELGDLISYYKVGMELYYSAGSDTIRYLKEHGKKVFLDLKLHDIPNTVGHSVASVTRLGVNLITVHAAGGRAMMQAATRYAKITADELGVERPKILAVTVLTSFDDQGWQEVGGHLPIQEHVLELASLAKSSGVDGVVASPREAGSIREMAGKDDFLIVTPGIRPSFAQTDDQKRIATPSQAFKDGSSMLVIGRPITQAIDPCAAARLILKEIKENA